MAYVSFAPDDSVSLSFAATAQSVIAPVRSATLSSLELSVIAVARNDRMATLRTPGWLGRVAGFLFGGRFDPRLPDPRLEALRRLAVIVWHRGYDVATREEEAFLAAGYSASQYRVVVTSITQARQSDRNRLSQQRHQPQVGNLA